MTKMIKEIDQTPIQKTCSHLKKLLKTASEENIRKILKDYLPIFAIKILTIRTDTGVKRFKFNREQWYIHQKLEEQKSRLGYVRAILLKGRQQGCSTYVAARFYHNTIHSSGLETFIMAHEGKATSNLFGMVKLFHDDSPLAVRPELGRCNEKGLVFEHLKSAYKLGTAETGSTGRSQNFQLLHASEVAFWRTGEKQAAGVFQAVHLVPGTEIIMESTANGMGNFFHKQWKQAESGQSDYIAIFIPWYWHETYRVEVPYDFRLSEEELEYMETYGLDLQQMSWRRKKIQELGEILFKQEYPATADEAFQVTGKDKLIKTEIIMRARKQKPYRSFGAIIVGYDPKRDGMDRDCVIWRQGLNAFGLKYYDFDKPGPKIALCKRILTGQHNGIIPDALFVDYGGGGWEIAGILRQDLPALEKKIKVVNFGATANIPELYSNKRNEIWGEMEKWLADINEPPSIPDDDNLHADLAAPGYDYDSRNRKVMQSKKKIKEELGCSPDGGDALALTFAETILVDHVMEDSEADCHLELSSSGL